MKKTSWILLIIFAVLAAATYFYLNKEDQTSSGDEFAIKNIGQIAKIVMWDKMKRRITLTKEDNIWQVNGKYRARQDAVDLVLNTFQKLHVRAMVPKAAEENVRRDLNTNGIIVEAYNKAGKALKIYYIGTATKGSMGTYMMQKGGKYPYEVGIPNWEGVLGPRFMLEEVDWKDRGVFRYKTNDIKGLSVEYFQPERKENSFRIDKDGSEFKVQKLYGLSEKRTAIKQKVLYYLKGYESLVAEAFESDNPKRETFVNATPFCEIKLETNKGEQKNVKLYPLPGRQTGELNDGTPIRANVERYYASINNNEEFMLVQDRVFQRILAPSDFFFSKED